MCTCDKPLRKRRGSENKSVELCFIKILLVYLNGRNATQLKGDVQVYLN